MCFYFSILLEKNDESHSIKEAGGSGGGEEKITEKSQKPTQNTSRKVHKDCNLNGYSTVINTDIL